MAFPVLSHTSGLIPPAQSKYARLYNNPMFDYLSEMLPQSIKDSFKWCELLYNSMPVIANCVRKLVNYPVTGFSFVDESTKIRESTKDLIDKIHLKEALLDLGTDRYVYGNGFRTVYFPFKRFLKCQKCKQITALDKAKFSIRRKSIELDCACGWHGPAEIQDVPSRDISQIRIVRWDPKQIELTQNPITGGTKYYYALPGNLVNAIRRGDVTVLRDTPKLFVDAALQGKNVALGENFFHSRVTTLSGYASGWGISPMLPALKTFMYVSVLRKAAEAIGMEHITPQRILFPQTNGTNDPSVYSSMERWRVELQTAIDRWRADPNYVMLAPFPTGVTNVGSQGRALAPTEEIKDARNEIAMALDIPPNILMGDATIQASGVGLRILENQLTPVTDSLQTFANWVIDMINAQLNTEYCHVTLVPFRLADDMMNKQMIMQMAGQAVSMSTVLEALNLNPDDERRKLRQETLSDHDAQMEVQKEIQDREQNAAQQAQDDMAAMETGHIPPYNQQKMIAMAQDQAMQLLQMPYEQRRSAMAQLQNEDAVMYAMVKEQMFQLRQQDAAGGGQPQQ